MVLEVLAHLYLIKWPSFWLWLHLRELVTCMDFAPGLIQVSSYYFTVSPPPFESEEQLQLHTAA